MNRRYALEFGQNWPNSKHLSSVLNRLSINIADKLSREIKDVYL